MSQSGGIKTTVENKCLHFKCLLKLDSQLQSKMFAGRLYHMTGAEYEKAQSDTAEPQLCWGILIEIDLYLTNYYNRQLFVNLSYDVLYQSWLLTHHLRMGWNNLATGCYRQQRSVIDGNSQGWYQCERKFGISICHGQRQTSLIGCCS